MRAPLPILSLRSPRHRGFTLLGALFLMSVLLLVILVLATSVGSGLRSATAQNTLATARQSALYGLETALGELQAAAGPDQRITARAQIQPKPAPEKSITPGRAYWTGVWDSSKYDPKKPAQKTFLRWLVSARGADGKLRLPSQTADPAGAGTPDEIEIFSGNDAAASVRVQKVVIDTAAGTERSFAFWVEDEGVKADLRWQEGLFPTPQRQTGARLSAAPGPDFGRWLGPFSKITYPIALGAADSWLNLTNKAAAPEDLQPLQGATAQWLRERRHDVTSGSLGVLADAKRGGLRRDLSLAFEMDGAEDDPTRLARFNAATGEFVGTGDRTTDPNSAHYKPMPGANFFERHLYVDTPRAGHLIRGPSWHAMRDYYNLYKRLKGTADDYTLQARATFPDRTTAKSRIPLVDMYMNGGIALSSEVFLDSNNPANGMNGLYRYMPLRGNYSPVVLGVRFLASLVAVDPSPGNAQAKLALCLDPIITLWNPHDVKIVPANLTLTFIEALPFQIRLTVRNNAATQTYDARAGDYMRANGLSDRFSFTLSSPSAPLELAPGEIVILSPSKPTGFQNLAANQLALPGYNMSPTAGYVLKRIPVYATPGNTSSSVTGSAEVPVDLGGASSVDARFSFTVLSSGATPTSTPGGRCWFELSMGGRNQPVQVAHNNLTAPSDGETLLGGVINAIPSGGLLNRKNWIGQTTFSAKASNHSYVPVEGFARFNPRSITTAGNPWRLSPFERWFSLSFGSSLNALLGADSMAIDPVSGRNGFWGRTYDSSGSTQVPLLPVPTAPLLSLAGFRNASLPLYSWEPMRPLGNSFPNPYLPADVLADTVDPFSYGGGRIDRDAPWGWDSSWYINDALWDRYFLSGIHPDYTLSAAGYQASSAAGGIKTALTDFFSATPAKSFANPLILPRELDPAAATEAVTQCESAEGFKRMAAYSYIAGPLNVNSTSVSAWAALLSGNRNLSVPYKAGSPAGSGVDNQPGIPFSKLGVPSGPSSDAWTGFSRLAPSQIWDDKGTPDTADDTGLAAEIVKQIQLRGPAQSVSDFVNRSLHGFHRHFRHSPSGHRCRRRQRRVVRRRPRAQLQRQPQSAGVVPQLPGVHRQHGRGHPWVPHAGRPA